MTQITILIISRFRFNFFDIHNKQDYLDPTDVINDNK